MGRTLGAMWAAGQANVYMMLLEMDTGYYFIRHRLCVSRDVLVGFFRFIIVIKYMEPTRLWFLGSTN